jgi:mRNA interferase MazF
VRGDVYSYRPNQRRGHEQQGSRYAIVVLASRFSHLSTRLVVPTSTSAHPYGFRPRVVIKGEETLALCDTTVSVDPEARLGDHVGYLTLDEMARIDETLSILLDLDTGTP